MDQIWLTLALLLGSFVFTFGFLKRVNEFYHVTIKLGKKRHSLPPGDLGWPFFGNSVSFLKSFKSEDPNSFIYNLAAKYGRAGIYRSYLFGSPAVIVCVPETFKTVLTDDRNFVQGYPASTMALAGRKSLHNISAAEHKRLRRLTTAPISGHEALSSYVSHIEDIVVRSLEKWSAMEEIEFLTELRKLSFTVITHIFLGSKSDSVIGKMEKLYTDLSHGLGSSAINLPGFAYHKALSARKKMVKILQGVLDERKTDQYRATGRQDMADMMIGIEDGDGGRLEDEDITDILLLYLFAGHESSAHSIMWVTVFLQEHPDFLQKAKEEQLDIGKRRPAGQEGLSLKEIREMSFTNKNFKGKVGSFLPFGLGSRMCPGADLARIEISIFLHYFLLNYNIERANPECPVLHLPVPKPADNCLARINKLS